MARDSLAGMRQFVSGFEDATFYVGIDVHKRSYYLALHRADGRTVSAVTPPAPSSAILHLLLGLKINIGAVAYESGPPAFPWRGSLRMPAFP